MYSHGPTPVEKDRDTYYKSLRFVPYIFQEVTRNSRGVPIVSQVDCIIVLASMQYEYQAKSNIVGIR